MDYAIVYEAQESRLGSKFPALIAPDIDINVSGNATSELQSKKRFDHRV